MQAIAEAPWLNLSTQLGQRIFLRSHSF